MTDRVASEALASRMGPFTEQERIECHHNFTQWENHRGENILVSRKGAIEAKEGQMGLIPGSMGTRSYVVRGLGNRASFNTAPHGAGRRMSRGQARRTFTMEDFDREMAGHGGQALGRLSWTRCPGPTRTSTWSWSSPGTWWRPSTPSGRS